MNDLSGKIRNYLAWFDFNIKSKVFFKSFIILFIFFLLFLNSENIAVAKDNSNYNISSVLQKFKKKYDSFKTLRADFVQETYQSLVKEKNEEKGWLSIKKPDFMLWKYVSPVSKIALLDGIFVWMYLPQDHHLYAEKYNNFSQNLFYQLISGKIILKDSFSVFRMKELEKNIAEGNIILKLKPLQKQSTMDFVLVELSVKNFLIQKTTVVDYFGNKTICLYLNYIMNPKIKDEIFSIKVDKNVTLTDFIGNKLPKSLIMKSKSISCIDDKVKSK